MRGYDHKKIEKKWQNYWAKKGIYKSLENPRKKKQYVLDMFPYPSGEGLHVGHPKGYIATDVYSRTARMQGKQVLHPMGWDAFGLPAENYAIKNKVHPRKAVEKNVKRFKEQLKMIGLDYDWGREINTTDPDFYKWTQWIFLKLYEKGLAYESFEPINWCPTCQTGLSNEDLEGNTCERCGTIVEKRPMRQWVLRITKYADRLLEDLELLPEWQSHIKESQRNWIGKSEGAEMNFELYFDNEKLNENRGPNAEKAAIQIFTTRPDTLFGATFLILSPEHPWVTLACDDSHKEVLKNQKEVRAYVKRASEKTEIERQENKDKTGVKLEGVKAINPATGEKIPMFVADYVLSGYGTGAIMAVPAHDERDAEFARKFGLPIKEVILPRSIDEKNPHQKGKEIAFRKQVVGIVRNPTNGKYLVLKWKKQPWVTFITGGIEEGEDAATAARREIAEETGYENLKLVRVLGGPIQAEFFAAHKGVNRVANVTAVLFELEDETRHDISPEEREKHEIEWRDRKDVTRDKMQYAELPIILERIESGNDLYSGEGILINSQSFDGLASTEAKDKITEKFGRKKTTYKIRDWVFSRQRYWGEPIPMIHCPKDGLVPVPEKDLPVKLPDVKNYKPTGTGESPLAAIDKWVNVKCPKCKGPAKRETNTMPQWAGSSWYYLRYMDPKNKKAMVDKKKEKYWAPVDLYVGGAEHATRHLIYARFWHKFLYDQKYVSTKEPFTRLISVGLIQAEDGRKMSKRFGNVINPDDIVKMYGADTLRVYEMFMGPFTDAIAWNTNSMIGARRFLERVWRLQEKVSKSSSETVEKILHRTVKKVGEDIQAFKFNTAISTMMIFLNVAEKEGITKDQFRTFVKLLAPFAPHIGEDLWQSLGNKKSVHVSEWPKFETKYLEDNAVKFVVQVNGKVRGTIELPAETTEQELRPKAEELVKKWLESEIKKVVFVPRRLINFVIA